MAQKGKNVKHTTNPAVFLGNVKHQEQDIDQKAGKFLEDAANVFPSARYAKKPNKKYKLNMNKTPVEELSKK